jgi:hypothetical protein
MNALDAAVLSAIRSDLLNGNLAGLAEHLNAMSDLESRLPDYPASFLVALRSEADRNREILAAAAGGVRAALRRLREAQEASSIYGQDGRRLRLDLPPPAADSRA